MPYNIQLILTDLDDTLLRSDKTISERTAVTLAKCRSKGILVGFSTLRGRDGIAKYISQINPDVLICNGGSMVYYKDNVIHQETFLMEQSQRLLAEAYRIIGDRCEMTLDTPDSLYWNRKDDKSATYEVKCRYDDMRDFREPVCKICVQTDNADIARRIAAAAGDISYIPFSDIPWYKFSPKNATKENGIHILSKKLNIPTAQMAAFGDDFSDIGMLQAVGYGIAMGNAIVPVKNAALEITAGCNDDGVAEWLEKNVNLS
ncbi:MAG: HAD family phosphatase [Spirochaetales bacterium]|nr:HAD family phosphatase [Spirochaetales bacterium]